MIAVLNIINYSASIPLNEQFVSCCFERRFNGLEGNAYHMGWAEIRVINIMVTKENINPIYYYWESCVFYMTKGKKQSSGKVYYIAHSDSRFAISKVIIQCAILIFSFIIVLLF